MTFARPTIIDTAAAALAAFPALGSQLGTVVEPPRGNVSTIVETFDPRWRRRLLVESADRTPLVGPIALREDCLSPLIETGALLWFDTALAPEHGDIVLCSVEAAYVERLIENAWSDPSRHAELSGRAYETLLVKQFVVVNGEPALVAFQVESGETTPPTRGKLDALAVRATVRGVLRFVQRVRHVNHAELRAVLAG